jgi:hypoxanthine phosphoribosyltransferase
VSDVSEIEQVFTSEAIARRMSELGAEIRRDAGDAEVFLLGILKGTSCFLADLLRTVPGPVTYDFVDVVSDVSDTATADAVRIDYLSYTNIAGRNVYVLKDVVSTGIIETYFLSQFRMHGPASLKLVALLDRPELRTIDLGADFRAFEVTNGSYCGYGLELQNRYGNLPYIGRLSS